jgi:HEAT repeat protein
MLETLDQVDWPTLRHAYGSAADVPVLIRSLTSDDPAVREETIRALHTNIWHQGTVYEASAYAVPFLVELLRAPEVNKKGWILSLLHAIGTGTSFNVVHGRLDLFRQKRDTPEFKAETELQLSWVRAAHAAVRNNGNAYLECLASDDPDIRAAAPFTLSIIPELPVIISALTQACIRETSPPAKASIVLGLLEFARHWKTEDRREDLDALHTLLLRLLRSDAEANVVRAAAAVALARLNPSGNLDELLRVFRSAIGSALEEFNAIPWSLNGDALQQFGDALPPDPSIQTPWLCDMLQHPHWNVRFHACGKAFKFCAKWRAGPESIVPRLAPLVYDPEPRVRKYASQNLIRMGRTRTLAVGILGPFRSHPDPAIRESVEQTVQKLAVPVAPPGGNDLVPAPRINRSVNQWISILDAVGPKTSQHRRDAIRALDHAGEAARPALPSVRRAFEDEDPWIRLHAARIIWRLERDPSLLPFFIELLREKASDLLVHDTLSSMGSLAAPAIPYLRAFLDSETRPCQSDYFGAIENDERHCEAALRTLHSINSSAPRESGPP